MPPQRLLFVLLCPCISKTILKRPGQKAMGTRVAGEGFPCRLLFALLRHFAGKIFSCSRASADTGCRRVCWRPVLAVRRARGRAMADGRAEGCPTGRGAALCGR